MLVVNLFAGPGAGKSTVAAATFAALKDNQVSTELVTEFAKECAWEGRHGPLSCQPYVFGEQLWRIERLRGRGVEVVVTDSPILLSAIYAPADTPSALYDVVRAYHARQSAMNVFLRRVKPYETRGRFQTADEASALDGQILELLRSVDEVPLVLPGHPASAQVIARMAMVQLGLIPSEKMT